MKKIAMFTLLSCLLLIVSGCASSTPKPKETKAPSSVLITSEKAKDMMDKQDVIVLDVRTLEEYKKGHIPNAKSLPLDCIDKDAEKELKDKSATILLYCQSGKRSAKATRKLLNLGYEKLYDFGGINEWPYAIEK